MKKRLTPRTILIIVLLFVVGFMAYFLISGTSHSGKTRVSVEVIPEDAKVTINGEETSSGDLYLKPGEYTISAEKDGFKKYSRFINVGKEPVDVGLVPEAQSEAAKAWLEENPDIQIRRESIGGKNAELNRQQSEERTPLIKDLPYTDITGPFTIDYGPDPARPGYVLLQISNSTPKGRVAAQNWITERGQSLSDINIIYSDFVNPLGRPQEGH